MIRRTPEATLKHGRFSSQLLQTQAVKRQQDSANSIYSRLSITELLKQVNARNLRYAPTTSRRELERMLVDHDDSHHAARNEPTACREDKNQGSNKHASTPSSNEDIAFQTTNDSVPLQQTHRSNMTASTKTLAETLQELDRRGIRYSPTATPQELIQMLQKEYVAGATVNSDAEKTRKNYSTNDMPRLAQRSSRNSSSPSLPISTLLERLDSLNIRYSPAATRQELEQLLQESMRSELTSPSASTASVRRQQRMMRRARLEQQSVPSSVFGSFLASPLPKKAKKSVTKAIHKAKVLSRKANEFLYTDDDGVRDVTFEYVKPDRVAASRLQKAQEARKKMSDLKESTAAGRAEPSRLARLPPAESMEAASAFASNDRDQDPINNQKSASPKARPRNRSQSSSPSKSKRIYSPYGAEPAAHKDSLDRLGDFLADSADRIMWGSFDTDGNATADDTNAVGHKPRHWKDRLEERFDSMLGIHNDGEFYNSWTKKVKEDQKKQSGYDSLSVARGRRPKRRGMPGRKKSNDKAIWEQDNLVSLLFGHNSNGSNRLFDKILSPNGSILNLFTAVFKSGLIIASYLCRWASCRGALPQPIVVVGMSTAILSARPRYRFRIVAMTLIVMRAVGELLHGYVYGDDGWEDDEEENIDADDLTSKLEVEKQ
ncbi:hypothetical protein MPSEU_000906800 [Mayamaea pseudoterrestris]|nr:hypothetical protein MPSEU_000906800 [Mayamaea pseudoterrestris]